MAVAFVSGAFAWMPSKSWETLYERLLQIGFSGGVRLHDITWAGLTLYLAERLRQKWVVPDHLKTRGFETTQVRTR